MKKMIGLLVTLSIVAPLLAGVSACTSKAAWEKYVVSGWQPQAQLGDGSLYDVGFARDRRSAIPKAFGLEAATPRMLASGVPVGGRVRFAPVHIYLDPGDKPLAAYQFELRARTGQIKIVGVEGGAHPAFREAPYYDPAALMNDRIIIAAFNTGSDLPRGRTRVATIHLQILGDAEPQYELKLIVAADKEGERIPADLNLQMGESK